MSDTKKVLLVDGNWNLKRNFYKRKDLTCANGKLCGGTFGFLDSMRSVINKLMPDKVIVAWDGYHAGKMRYEIYKPYKANRDKNWEIEDRVIINEGVGSVEDEEKFQLLSQKIDTQTYLEELFIRQLECDYVEADDFIAYYILGNKKLNEHIYIFSRDKDFHQLISKNVSIITPDSFDIINIDNFKQKFGYTIENSLLFKCFEGDSSDNIEGVKGVTTNTLLKYFPNSSNERYTYNRIVEESYKINEERIKGKPKKKPLDTLNRIIDSEHILYRNAKLMNLKKPLLTKEGVEIVDSIRNEELDLDRSIESAMNMFAKDGMVEHVWNRDLQSFFAPFYRLIIKEKEVK